MTTESEGADRSPDRGRFLQDAAGAPGRGQPDTRAGSSRCSATASSRSRRSWRRTGRAKSTVSVHLRESRGRRRARLAERPRRRAAQVPSSSTPSTLGRLSDADRLEADVGRLLADYDPARPGPGRVLPRHAPVDPGRHARRGHQYRPDPPRGREGAGAGRRDGPSPDMTTEELLAGLAGVLGPARARPGRGRRDGPARARRVRLLRVHGPAVPRSAGLCLRAGPAHGRLRGPLRRGESWSTRPPATRWAAATAGSSSNPLRSALCRRPDTGRRERRGGGAVSARWPRSWRRCRSPRSPARLPGGGIRDHSAHGPVAGSRPPARQSWDRSLVLSSVVHRLSPASGDPDGDGESVAAPTLGASARGASGPEVRRPVRSSLTVVVPGIAACERYRGRPAASTRASMPATSASTAFVAAHRPARPGTRVPARSRA